jgi:uncharacterized SAM-binding protein YcdF (DUF218 family)
MRRRRIVWLLAVLAFLVAAFAGHPVWLAAAGHFLVRAGAPAPADAVLVLAGDTSGHRILKGAELVRQGFAPRVFVSGPAGFYGAHECDLAIPFAVKRGYPESDFVPLPHEGRSTREEAQWLLPELRRRGVRRLLLVTSDYHTRRAGAVFRAAGRDFDVLVVAAPDEFFTAGRWWMTRQGRKRVAAEVAKTLADWIGL